jgi:hypothetical protein
MLALEAIAWTGISYAHVRKCRMQNVAASRLKPLVKSSRRQFLAQRKLAVLAAGMEEVLFRHADVISEGNAPAQKDARKTYFGSTMIAIPFERLAREISEPMTAPFRAQLVRAIEGSVRVRLRAMRLARAEAGRRVDAALLGTAFCDLRVSDAGKVLRIDVDLEVELRVSSRANRS